MDALPRRRNAVGLGLGVSRAGYGACRSQAADVAPPRDATPLLVLLLAASLGFLAGPLLFLLLDSKLKGTEREREDAPSDARAQAVALLDARGPAHQRW